MKSRTAILPAAALLAALTALVAACGGEDPSPGLQDISFRLALAPQPPLAQGAESGAALEVQDDDSAQTPSDAEPFSSPVDVRLVAPMPPGISADSTRNPIRPGDASSLTVRASADAQAGQHQLLVAGQISGSSTTRFFPHRVSITGNCAPGTDPVERVFPSRHGRTIALTRSGAAFLWGTNRIPPHEEIPVEQWVPEALDFYSAQRIEGLPPAVSAASGGGVSAFVLADGGTLQIVTRYYRSAVRAPNGRAGWFIHAPGGTGGFRQVVASADAFHALRDDGTVWRFTASTLEDADGTLRFAPAAQVEGFADVVQLAAGSFHLLARRADGSVLAQGANEEGQLGDGTRVNSPTPIVVAGLTGVTDIAAGDFFSLALLGNATVVAWGRGGEGQLGYGINANANRPVQVVSRNGNPVSNVIALAAGRSHALAHLDDASVWSWGSGSEGQLGGGTPVTQPVAAPVAGVSALRISAGAHSSFAVVFASGTIEAWGENLNGRLGDGTVTARSEPTRALGLGRGEGLDCRAVEAPPAAVVFEDGEFADTNWQAIVSTTPNGPVATATRAIAGGNPDAYRRMTDTLGQGPASLEVFHQNLTAVYEPAQQGAIDRIDYRDDRILFVEVPSPQNTVGADLAFRQGDRVFKINQIVGFNEPQWRRYEVSGLRRVDFIQTSGPACPPQQLCPDFSATGAPIVFGYWRLSAVAINASTNLFMHGIDNWRVTVHRAAQ